MSTFVKALGTAAKNILPAMLNVIKGLVSGITSGLPALFEGVGAGKGFLVGLIKSIATWIPQAITQIGQMLSNIADSIGTTGESKFGSTAAKIVLGLVKGLIQAIPSLVKGALELILALQGALISYAGNLVKAGIEAMKQFVQGFLKGHPQISKAVKTIGKVFSVALKPVITIIKTVTKVWKALMGQKSKKSFSVSAPFSKAIQSIKDVFSKWKDVLGQKAKKTFEVAKKGFSSVLSGMKSLYNKWKDILGQKSSKTFTTTYKTKGKPSGKDGKGRLGIREVPYDGYVAELHKGEVVLTAAETNQLLKKQGGGVSNGDNFTVNVYGSNNMNVEQLAAAVERRIIKVQKRRTSAWA
jgi:phage-related protein